MKKTFLFLAALAMSAVSMAASATYTKVTSNPTDWSGDYILVYETDGAARVFTGVDAANDFVEATISDNTITGEFVTLTLETTDGGYLVKINGGDNDGKYISHSANSNGLSTGTSGAVMTISYDESVLMTNAGGAVMRYNKTSGQDRFRFYKASSYTQQQPVQLYKAGSTPTPVTLDSLVIKGKAEKMEYEVGEAFDPAGLEVWGIYTKIEKHDSTSQIKSGITWTIDPETFEEVSDNASVTLVASYKDLTTADTTITGIKVSAPAPLPKYATIYTSNVVLTAGENSSDADIIYGGETYDGVKCGTSSKAGSCTTTISAATKMLHFHAIGWKGAAATTLTVNGTEYTITPDDGITGNPPFTLVGDAYVYYYTFDPKGATEITFTSDKRFVVFGVNEELQEGVLAAPTFEPTATDFDTEVEVTLTAEEGAEIFYALNEEVTSMNAIKYTEPIELIETTTIYAVAKKDGKESEQASKTYTLIPAYTVEEIAAITPAGQKAILVFNDDEIVDIYTGKSGDVSGLYFQATDKKIELYNQSYAFPKTWEKGGKVSGRVMGEWVDFNGTWELKIATEEIDKLSYTAPGEPTRIINPKANKVAKKAIVKGQIMIIRDNRTYNVLGF